MTGKNSSTPGLKVLGAMRYSEFRKYWFATLASVIGFQMFMFSQLWLVRQLEENPIWLGALGLATGIPAIVLNLFGGVVADRFDRKRVIMGTQILSGLLIFILAILTFLEIVLVWHVLFIAFLNGAVRAFNQPAHQALFPHLIERSALMNAVALTSSIWQSTRVMAPAFAGIIISIFDTEVSLFVSSLAFLVGFTLMALVNAPSIPKAERKGAIHDLLLGARFVLHDALFSTLIAMTFFNSFFGMIYLQLMPVFVVDILNMGAKAQGFLVSVGGIGALLGTLVATVLGRFPHRGWLILSGSTLFGGFIFSFGLSGVFVLSLVLIFLAGFFQSIYMISIMTSLQMRVPDELRGRVMGIYGMTYNLMPMGGMLGGVIASVVGAPFAVAFGGSAVSGFSILMAIKNRNIRQLGNDLLPNSEGKDSTE